MHRGTPHKGSVKHKGFSKQRQKITEKQHTSQASYTLSKKRKRVVQSKGSPHQPSKQHMKLSDEASLSKKSETQRKTLSLHKKRIKLNDDNPQRTKLEHQSNKSPVDAENKALSRQKLKKKLTEARKKHAKPHFELGKEVKELWETLRKKKLEKTEHARITATILQKMKGKAKEMVTSHVMSRVLQTCLKFCNAEERASIYEELRPQFLELAQNTYAHHLVLKMLDHAAADKKQLQKMIASLHGHVVAYLRHPVASAVVEHAYKLASSAQKQELLAEFFSPEYRLFKGIVSKTPCRLVDLLAQEPATKRRSVMEHMAGSLQPILEKGIVDHSIIHRALIEYLSIAGKAMATDILQQLSGPSLIRVIHTREGAKIGVTCVSIGTRKGKPNEDGFKTRRKEPLGKQFSAKGNLITRLTVPPLKKKPYTGKTRTEEAFTGKTCDERKASRVAKKCYICEEEGHFANECPQMNSQVKDAKFDCKGKRPKPSAKLVPYLVGDQQNVDATELCRAWGEVGDQEVLVFFDSGACANFISPKLASKLGFCAKEMGMTGEADKDWATIFNGFSDCFSDSFPDELTPERPEDHSLDPVPGSSLPNRPLTGSMQPNRKRL
ncbi:hypothetical protein L7F22_001571 [Adiantum nelumboides]|nr:hypothetical protein [Adiantum nelumboides]